METVGSALREREREREHKVDGGRSIKCDEVFCLIQLLVRRNEGLVYHFNHSVYHFGMVVYRERSLSVRM